MAPTQGGEPLAQRGRGWPRRRLGAQQLAEALDRADDVVEPLRLEPEQADAGAFQLVELAGGVAVPPDDDEVGLQGEQPLDVDRETSPIRGIARVAAGKSLLESTATIAPPPPAANTSSVRLGARVTMRAGGRSRRSSWPASSTATTGAARRSIASAVSSTTASAQVRDALGRATLD